MSDHSAYVPFSLTDTDLIALVTCPRHRLVVVAPGFTIEVAQAIATTWNWLGAGAVRLVLDPDPEVRRMGFGELAALQLLRGCGKVGNADIPTAGNPRWGDPHRRNDRRIR